VKEALWLEHPVPVGAMCIFNDGPAVAMVVYAHSPYAPKPVCAYHVAYLNERLTRRDSKLRHPSHKWNQKFRT